MTVVEKPFAELTPFELYEILALRQRVFAVEQNCVYQDCDGHDAGSRHLWLANDGRMIAYARILPAGEKYEQASLGRVVTAPEARKTGAGRAIVAAALEAIERAWGRVPVKIGAQAYLQKFYGSFGFVRVSDDYLEDGIPHLDMIRGS